MSIKAPWGHTNEPHYYLNVARDFLDRFPGVTEEFLSVQMAAIGRQYAEMLFNPPEAHPKITYDALVTVGECAKTFTRAIFGLGPTAGGLLPPVENMDASECQIKAFPSPLELIVQSPEFLWVYKISSELYHYKEIQKQLDTSRMDGGRPPNLTEHSLVWNCAKALKAQYRDTSVPRLARGIHSVVTRDRLPKKSQKFDKIWDSFEPFEGSFQTAFPRPY